MKYLIDTSELINFLKGKRETVAEFKQMIPDGIGISVIAIAEYFYGIELYHRPEMEKKLLLDFLNASDAVVLDVNQVIAEKYGQIQGYLSQKGRKGEGFDLLIAAAAIVNNLILYTGNHKHFDQIPNLSLY